jgi:uncharacterized membrane protein
MNSLSKFLYALLTAAALAHSAYYYPLMPARMAVHFGVSGSPDGWSTRTEFFVIAAAMLVVNVAVFAALPWTTQRFRLKKLSLPRSKHWLAEGNIDGFYEYFRGKMAWFGIANVAFGSLVLQLVYSANLSPGAILNGSLFTALLVAYFVFVIIWLFTFFSRMRKE